MEIKNKNITIFILILIFNIYIFNDVCLNENEIPLEITQLIEKFFNSPEIVLNEEEKLIAKFWRINSQSDVAACPFTTLTTHGLTRDEASLLIDFFQIEDAKELENLRKYIQK